MSALNNAGQNNNDENKLNILFINIGEDPSLFQAVAKQMTEEIQFYGNGTV